MSFNSSHPLRSRGSDILQLATLFLNHFAKKIGEALVGISQPAAEKLLAYSWQVMFES